MKASIKDGVALKVVEGSENEGSPYGLAVFSADKQEFLDIMQQTMQERHYSLMLLMLTDVLLEGTQLIYLGDEETIQQAFSSEAKNNVVFLPGVMSRKKQIIPTLSAMWG